MSHIDSIRENPLKARVYGTRIQSNIMRYSLFRCIKPQSLSDHIARATQIAAHTLDDIYIAKAPGEIAKSSAIGLLGAVLFHDFEEAFLGDVPNPVKKDVVLNARYTILEAETVSALCDGQVRPWLGSHDGAGRMTSDFVSLIDAAEALLYISEEVEMGNVSMREMLKRVIANTKSLYRHFSISYLDNNLGIMATLAQIITEAEAFV